MPTSWTLSVRARGYIVPFALYEVGTVVLFGQGCYADLSVSFTPYEGVSGTFRLSLEVSLFGVFARSVGLMGRPCDIVLLDFSHIGSEFVPQNENATKFSFPSEMSFDSC